MTEMISLTHDGLLHMTAAAALFDFGDEQKWIPLSLIDPDTLADLDPTELNRPGEIIVPLWFVKQEGLEPYES
jgi:hypothetical protein